MDENRGGEEGGREGGSSSNLEKVEYAEREREEEEKETN